MPGERSAHPVPVLSGDHWGAHPARCETVSVCLLQRVMYQSCPVSSLLSGLRSVIHVGLSQPTASAQTPHLVLRKANESGTRLLPHGREAVWDGGSSSKRIHGQFRFFRTWSSIGRDRCQANCSRYPSAPRPIFFGEAPMNSPVPGDLAWSSYHKGRAQFNPPKSDLGMEKERSFDRSG